MWLPIDSVYEVSVEGEVKKNGKIMKGGYDTLGYRQVSQYNKLKMVHRLVASRWLPAPTDENCQIDHIDRNRSNNHASNLRWCSKSINMLNRDHKVPKTGQRYITLYTFRNGDIRYVVGFKKAKEYLYHTYHKTLEEAIIDRDNYLLSLSR